MAKKKGCLFGLILVSMILSFFTSCQFFENDVKDFMEKYLQELEVMLMNLIKQKLWKKLCLMGCSENLVRK